jgi:hypothetical protein
MGIASQATGARVAGFIAKYMGMLGIDGKPPVVRLIDRPEESWLARSIWDLERPHKTVLEFQTALVDAQNAKWLERSIAHEMIHYRDVLAKSKGADAADDSTNDAVDHGTSFHQGAAHINARMGENFVTAEVVELPSGALVSRSTLETAASRKKLWLALGIGSAALLGIAIARRPPRPTTSRENERGSYGTR